MNPNEVKVNLEDCKNFVCTKCGFDLFNPVLMIKNIPALMSPTGKEEAMPITIGFQCAACKAIEEYAVDGQNEDNGGSNIILN